MTTIIVVILITIFLFISGLHIYWGFGGKWGNGAVIPTKNVNIKVMMPEAFTTFIVALGLFGFAVLVFLCSVDFDFVIPKWLDIVHKYGLWVIASIFILRSIGDFNYVGFFKKYKTTKFGLNDTKYYSLLCLTIGILTVILELNR